MLNAENLITLFTSMLGGAGIAGIVAALISKRKVGAQATKIIEDAAGHLVEQYRKGFEEAREECELLKEDVNQMTEDVEKCKEEIKQLKRLLAAMRKREELYLDGVNRLCHQLQSMGKEPVWEASLLDIPVIGNGE